jgi:UDP-glucose 4-epimerase
MKALSVVFQKLAYQEVKMSKMFVTGGAGFIGSYLVDTLMASGHDVIVYDNLSTGSLDNIRQHSGKKNIRFIQGDLLDLDGLAGSMADCDTVFHLAAHADVRSGASDTRIDLDNGIIGTYNVLEAVRRNGIGRLVYASSAAVYGETLPVPMPESHGPLMPISLYGSAKAAGEALISAYCHTFNIQAWMFRFANIVGPRRKQGVIYDFVCKLKRNPAELEILGDGKQCKPYLHVEECVAGFLYAFEHAGERVNLFNIGVDSATDVTTIAEIVIKEMGLSGVKLNYTGGDRGWLGDAPQLRFDMSRMHKLGWHAKLSSDEAAVKAAREIVEWVT